MCPRKHLFHKKQAELKEKDYYLNNQSFGYVGHNVGQSVCSAFVIERFSFYETSSVS